MNETATMANRLANLPALPRAPGPGQVPAQKAERERLQAVARQYVSARELVPPLTLEELQHHADAVVELGGAAPNHRDFVTVLISNEVWCATLAGIPFERRILLLPQCLRTKSECTAALDELGLLCEQCGRCPTGNLQAEAEELGYIVLVAEGTTVVTKLLERGRADAVIGVSCLSVLERAFPHLAAHAVPGLAIPLHKDGCDQTRVDLDWVYEAIRLRSDHRWLGRVDIDRLRAEVEAWFQPGPLRAALGFDGTQTEEIALAWLVRSGKRWRPLLAVCVYKTLAGLGEDDSVPEFVRRMSVATECFHKASLVHDDIEDADATRYGEMTLHRRYGVPIALNAGDFLLGEGYRQIAESGATAEQIARMLAVAAEGHRSLCLGQGDELCWMRDPQPLSSRRVIDFFRRKTAPAFEVALRLGATCADANGEVSTVLKTFSEALGIAYQIQDDLTDFFGPAGLSDAQALRPSLLFALAYEAATQPVRVQLEAAWRPRTSDSPPPDPLPALLAELRVEDKARQWLEHYKNEAIRSLSPLRNAPLKALLRRLVGKILGGI